MSDVFDQLVVSGKRFKDCFDLYRYCLITIEKGWCPDYPRSETPREEAEALIAAHQDSWERIEYPERGAIALFRQAGEERHIGFVIDSAWFLHCFENTLPVRSRLDNPPWSNALVGFYRYSKSTNKER